MTEEEARRLAAVVAPNPFRKRYIASEPKLSDIARVFGMGMFWFASLASVVIAIGSVAQ